VTDDLLNLLKPIPEAFFEKFEEIDNANFIIFSVPIDVTSSYRSGSRFAPSAIRRASHYMESFSDRTKLDWDNLNLTDIGEIDIEQSISTTLEKIEKICLEIKKIGKIPVMLGGEHTISLGALNSLKPDATVVFDAHLDLRDTLFEEKICHATWLRRSSEKNRSKIVVIAARALSKEEVVYANTNNIEVITALDIKKIGISKTCERLEKCLKDIKSVYLSIDMDSLDPSEAPAVGNPCPEGISTSELLDIVTFISKYKICGVDLTEVCPQYDSGNTAIQAAYILLETVYAFEAQKIKIL
jgi:agmatinase